MFLGELIKKYRVEHNLSQRDFATKAGLSHTYVAALEKNIDSRNNKPIAPTLDTVKLIANALSISMQEILDILDDNQEFNIKDDLISAIPINIVGRISAGVPILAQENIEGVAYAPTNQIKNGKEYFYLKVSGDSMNLKFKDGDIVLIEKQEFLENGQIGVIRINGYDATIKRYRYENGLVILEPLSTNPINQIQIYDPNKIEIVIIGKAISYQGNID